MKKRELFLKVIIWFILPISIIFNLLFFLVDIFPVINNKLNEPTYLKHIDNEEVEKRLVNASYDMFVSTEMHMPWARPNNFIDKMRALRLDETTRIYNFPRAYLALGLIK